MTIRLNSMEAVEFPGSISDLDTAVVDVDGDNFAHDSVTAPGGSKVGIIVLSDHAWVIATDRVHHRVVGIGDLRRRANNTWNRLITEEKITLSRPEQSDVAPFQREQPSGAQADSKISNSKKQAPRRPER